VTTAKVMIILLMLTVILTTSTVLITTLARPSDSVEVAAVLVRLMTLISWTVLAVVWVGDKILRKIEEVRDEALGQIAGLANRWGDVVLAAELEQRLTRAEEGSSSSITWLLDKRMK
jgi:uncharacterized membrane protein